jgi:hypothetical protein
LGIRFERRKGKTMSKSRHTEAQIITALIADAVLPISWKVWMEMSNVLP